MVLQKLILFYRLS